MLTGDKLETAENIAESCKLLKPNQMEIHKLSTLLDVQEFCTDLMVAENNERLYKGEMKGILVEALAL
jgi:magnesium-transporting ATPase (P-type)